MVKYARCWFSTISRGYFSKAILTIKFDCKDDIKIELYQLNENVRMSINYQDWYPMAANMSNTAYLFFNLEFGIFESYKRI